MSVWACVRHDTRTHTARRHWQYGLCDNPSIRRHQFSSVRMNILAFSIRLHLRLWMRTKWKWNWNEMQNKYSNRRNTLLNFMSAVVVCRFSVCVDIYASYANEIIRNGSERLIRWQLTKHARTSEVFCIKMLTEHKHQFRRVFFSSSPLVELKCIRC